MDASLYWLGVLLALLAGSTTQLGSVFQKKAVNEMSTQSEFMRRLVKNHIWILGVILSFGVSAGFFLAAQAFIGPALIPGLTAFGLIVLALGSIKIVGEKLKLEDFLGILLMMSGIILLSLSQLSIEIIEVNLLEIGLVFRITLFTIILVILSILCYFFQKNSKKYKGILLAILSGIMFALSNLWVSQFIGTITKVFSEFFDLAQLIMCIIAAIMLIFSNIFGLTAIQHAYRVGKASHMVPIQQVPILISPIFIYFLVFLMVASSFISIVYLILGLTLIMISVFLFGKRAAQMEKIK
ncbi:MAG: hypothetical protein ACFFDF_16840 [Candidatus Odinarchaeota archaeon]